jgi:queuine tRNA-ribosyltransferase
VDPLSFRVEAQAADARARAGRLETPHGALATPAFFPVGTYGAVRGISVADLRAVGTQGVLANTYHLHLRPGEDVVAELGGLHGFMGWRGPILTDSGGFQVHSLEHLATRLEGGVCFRSPLDGSSHFLTPERAILIQQALGADLIAALDEFEPVPAEGSELAPETRERTRSSMERTLRWAERCRAAHTRTDQLLFGIVQGGGEPELRTESAERTVALGFAAYAVGGLGLGENIARRRSLLQASLAPLPPAAPRYLMGIGRPEDLLDAIAEGVDIFDCVLPTRNGRHGTAFTAEGPVSLRAARHRLDAGPIEADCECPACAQYSRGYLRHLLKIGEALGSRMVALHNLAFYARLMHSARSAIVEGCWTQWSSGLRERWAGKEDAPAESGEE